MRTSKPTCVQASGRSQRHRKHQIVSPHGDADSKRGLPSGQPSLIDASHCRDQRIFYGVQGRAGPGSCSGIAECSAEGV